MDLNKQRGQTTIEYILLLAVIFSLVVTFYNSQAYKRLFGTKGQLGKKIKTQSEFTYRHAFYDPASDQTGTADLPENNKDIKLHPSYVEAGVGTRFFGAKDAYP